ncbi:MAG: DUF5077 domain-containing protein [Pelomonas sp.]|nr:DUF5077 domain-containing protein [Roseateles sp.]
MHSLLQRIGGLLLASGFFFAAAAQAAPVSVPLGGNAFLTAAPADASIDDTGLHNWTSPRTTISTYVDVRQVGNLQVALVGGVFGSNYSLVKVSVDGRQALTVPLAPAGVAGAVFPVGTFYIERPGYVKIELQGVKKDGGYFGDISALQIDGAAAQGALFANDPSNFYWSRRGSSVHLGFNVPANTEYFYSEVTVPPGQDPIGSYFMANGFNVGYFGMQVNSPTERWILFSVWNPPVGTTKLVASGKNVIVDSFGGEGTGGQSHLVLRWHAGATYRFITRAQPDGQGNTLFSAWFGVPDDDAQGRQGGAEPCVKWLYIATWQYQGTAMYHQGVYSFLENFNPDYGWRDRYAQYGNQWAVGANGAWTEVSSAYYDVDPTGLNQQRADFAGGVADRESRFYLRNDGFFTPPVASGQTLRRAAGNAPPNVDLSRLPTH